MPTPTNKKLYNEVKEKVKSRVNKWPSAYASGQLVQEYKRKGGKYRNSFFGSLTRWFKEKWVDVCTGKPCGRSESERRGYPYCRPSKRVSSKSPKTVKELSKAERTRRCSKKRRNPKSRIIG
jgi:hypothetical protein